MNWSRQMKFCPVQCLFKYLSHPIGLAKFPHNHLIRENVIYLEQHL
jgi:hypothetical protein